MAGCVVGILVPAGLGWDFANFYDAGRRVAAGQAADLYTPASLIGGIAPQGTTGFFGAPLSALFYLPLSAFSPENALILFKVANVAAFFATFLLLFRFYVRLAGHERGQRWAFAAWFSFLCLIYQPFWTVFRVGGQTTPFVLLAMTVALVCHVRGAFWGSASGVAVAALIKPSMAPAVLFLLVVSGATFFRRAIVVFLVTGLLSLALLGWPTHLAFLALMRSSSRIVYEWQYNSSLFIVIENLRLGLRDVANTGIYPTLLDALAYGLKGAVIGLVSYLTVRSRRANLAPQARRHFDVQMATVLFLLFSLTVWEHYLSLLFPLLVYLVATRAAFSRSALAYVAAIFSTSVFQSFIVTDWIRTHVVVYSLTTLMGIALLKSAPLLLTLLLLWRHRGEILSSHALPAWRDMDDARAPCQP